MAKGRNLAGLAALGALGMMLSKGKGKSADRDTDTGVDVMPSYAASKPAADLGEIRAEDGTLSKLRRNTETGDLYSPNEPITRPTATRSTATATAPAPAPSMPAGAYRGMRSDTKNVGGGRSSGRGGPEAGEEAAYRAKTPATPAGAYRGMRSDMPRVNPENMDAYDMSYNKKGGKISSASSRADGIASRGKTRGKVC